jgi:hypothetical protein
VLKSDLKGRRIKSRIFVFEKKKVVLIVLKTF